MYDGLLMDILFTKQNLPKLEILDMAFNNLPSFNFDYFDQVSETSLYSYPYPFAYAYSLGKMYLPKNELN